MKLLKKLSLLLSMGGILMTVGCSNGGGSSPKASSESPSAIPSSQPISSEPKSGTPSVKMDKTFYNPLDITKGLGDPWLYKHTDGYYYYTHSNAGGVKVTKTKSPTFLRENDNDESRTKVIFRMKSIDVIEIWAPEVFFFKGHWYCYFTATVDEGDTLQKDTNRRTYGMKSKTEDIFGEWEVAKKILLPDDFRSIDATFFEYNDRQYICYAGWPAKENQNYRQHLYIQLLEKDNPLKVDESEKTRHCVSEPTNIWEIDGGTAQNEGPAVSFAPDGTPILFYSGSYSGGDNYCIAYLKLTGKDILDGECWTKCAQPLMAKDMEYSEIIAPGHNSVFKSPDGTEDWICYHSAKRSGSGWDRQVRLQKMTWDGNTPVVEKIYKASDEAPLPSGDVVNRYKFEAENAFFDETKVFVVEHAGYASNNKSVSISSGEDLTFEVAVKFEVAIPKNGLYAVGIRYSNRDSTSTKIYANVNNTVFEVFAPNTQYDDTYMMTWFFTDLYINEYGQNIIKLSCDSSIYLDCIVVDYLDHK